MPPGEEADNLSKKLAPLASARRHFTNSAQGSLNTPIDVASSYRSCMKPSRSRRTIRHRARALFAWEH
jgi:hypothetical protein